MTRPEAIEILQRLMEPEAWEPKITQEVFEALAMGCEALTDRRKIDLISRTAAVDVIRKLAPVEIMHDVQLIDKAEAMTELMFMSPAVLR